MFSQPKKYTMKFAIDSNHRDFFEKNHLIEFEAFLDTKHLDLLSRHIQTVLDSKLGGTDISSESRFMAGRDLFREDSMIRKLLSNRQWAQIVSQLTDVKPIKLGFDQYIPALPSQEILEYYQTPYIHLVRNKFNLQEMSSLQGVVCGLMLCLKDTDKNNFLEKPTLFPGKKGHAVFFGPLAPIDFEDLRNSDACSYFLIVYTRANAVYILNPKDPNTYALKNYGYSFGDKLVDKWNPILFR